MKAFAASLLLIATFPAYAAPFNKCVDAAGNILLTDEPCAPTAAKKRMEEAPTVAAPQSTSQCSGKPESTSDIKSLPGENVIAKLALAPGVRKEVAFSSQVPQAVTFRVSANEALRCKYAQPPTAMSPDGKNWQQSYFGGQILTPIEGTITVFLRNSAQETIYFLVVTDSSK